MKNRLIEGKYLVTDYKIDRIKKKDGTLVNSTYAGSYKNNFFYILDEKVFDSILLFSNTTEYYTNIVSSSVILSKNIKYNTQSSEYRLHLLGEMIKEIDKDNSNLFKSFLSIPFRTRLKKYPFILTIVGEDEEGVENHRSIFFRDYLKILFLIIQRNSNIDVFISLLKYFDFVESIEDNVITIHNLKKIFLDEVEITKDEFKNLIKELIEFFEDEMLEMSFINFQVKNSEVLEWVDLSK